MVGSVLYATDLFEATTIAAFTDMFVRVLSALAADPDTAVNDASLIAPDVAEQVGRWSVGAPTAPVYKTIPTQIGETVRRAPDAVALISRARHLTYGEFGARVRDLALRLIDEASDRIPLWR